MAIHEESHVASGTTVTPSKLANNEIQMSCSSTGTQSETTNFNNPNKKKKKTSVSASSETIETPENCKENMEISHSDLEELRSVYKKCKSIIHKIETKYSHLLIGLRSTKHSDVNKEDPCSCKPNKKIVFDDSGNQVEIEAQKEDHICPHKLKRKNSVESEESTKKQILQVEYSQNHLVDSDNLVELQSILRSHDIDKSYRNEVIRKVTSIRQQYANDLKMNKHELIENLKNNSDEILQFNGTNLSSLPGYKCI